MSYVRGWLEELSDENPIRLTSYVLLFAAIMVIGLSLWFYDFEFLKNILVEAHGMLFDLLVISVFLFWLQSIGEKRRERRLNIQRYREEIEDYLGWDEKEAMYRIVGNINRLNREGVTAISLVGAFLKGANLTAANLSRADLSGANLERAEMGLAEMEGAFLSGTNLSQANLFGANLRGANLEGAFLLGTNLSGAGLHKANLHWAKYNTEPYEDEFGITYRPTLWPAIFDPVAAGAIDVSKEVD